MENGQEVKGSYTYVLDKRRLVIMGIVILIIWFSILAFWFFKADEITKDPCTICAKRMGETVKCTTGDFIPVNRYYYPNGTIYQDNDNIKTNISSINFSFAS